MEFIQKGLKMLIVSSYPPRECGLATFSEDTVNAINRVLGYSLPVEVCALENSNQNYEYSSKVSYVLNTHELANYRKTGEEINLRNDIGLICIQHEFGLFGGDLGDYILSFLLSLNKPVVTVFHTVLPDPDKKRKIIVQSISDLSEKIIVLTNNSKSILCDEYDIAESKIVVIPHGTHMVLWQQKERLKKQYHYEDKIVLSTFGLLSENKNIETVLYALPEIVQNYPNVIYLILGKTHPEVFKNEGEKYRDKLISITEELLIQNNVIFVNEYMELNKLLEYLTLTDIYLFTSKDQNQAVSGTFAYALSCGCAVIATPIPNAKEVIADSGILLNHFENPGEFKDAIQFMIENKHDRLEMSRNAYIQSHATTWENIAIQLRLLLGTIIDSEHNLKFKLPPLKLNHIKKLTTDTGMLQFSNFSEPDISSGYTLDDNVRALIVVVTYLNQTRDQQVIRLAEIYLKFIEGIQRPDGKFDNFKNFEGELTPQNSQVNLEDSNGRAMWSLGMTIANHHVLPDHLIVRAEKCWDKAFHFIDSITSPRAIAYIIKGLYQYHTVYPTLQIECKIKELADTLLSHYHINSSDNWYWFEDYMTYANNVLPEAMMYSYLVTNDERYKEIAIVTFDFLLSHYFMKGELKVISNNGWFKKENERAFYGEQPIEVVTTIVALDLFYEVTRNIKYKDQLDVAFSWFLGNNHLKQIMYNPVNGASYDGLEDKQININQGAESTLCFFKAQMIMKKYADRVKTGNIVIEPFITVNA